MKFEDNNAKEKRVELPIQTRQRPLTEIIEQENLAFLKALKMCQRCFKLASVWENQIDF